MDHLTDIDRGLTEAEAAARFERDGPNTLPDPERKGVWRIVLEVLREPMFALLLAGGVVYLMIGDTKEALVLIAFASLSVVIAVIQGLRSEKVLDALRDLTQPQATVIREGLRRRIPSAELVRGDIVSISEGERAPADGILRAGHEVEADESLLTGESVPVHKHALAGDGAADDPAGARIVYSGSLIVRGQGLAQVTATGLASEIGRIGGALGRLSAPQTRLAREIHRIVQVMGLIGIVTCLTAVILFGLLRGPWLKAVLSGIALGMSMLPEEFPLVLTVFMVMGAWRISQAKVLTRRASAIETLGSATVLCTDKTGTLTLNRMVVAQVWTERGAAEWAPSESPPPEARAALRAGVLASAEHPFDPMERAFHDAAQGWLQRADGSSLVRSFGLTSSRLAVTQVWREGTSGRLIACAKGAPETILALCRVDDRRARGIMGAVQALAADGMRVIAVAQDEEVQEPVEAPEALSLRFLGLVALADPLRPDAAAAVSECQSAGVRVVMITGDHPATARAIARSAGIESGGVLTGDDLQALSDAELVARIGAVRVFARIRPEQKLRIVRALQQEGEVVAMTGDGVNDAPALKAADIGIAMGRRGTDVAREASALILLDDDFGSIVKAMRLGRRIYDNLQKAMTFILAVHVPIAGLALFPLVFGLPVLLSPVHIALLEMIIDPVCSIVFEAEAEEPNVMRRPPRAAGRPLFGRRRVGASLFQGGLLLVVVGGLYAWGPRFGVPAQAIGDVSFLALVFGILALVQADRSFDRGFGRPNRPFLAVTGAAVATMALILTVPQARDLLQFTAITWRETAVAVGAGAGCAVLLAMARRFGLGAR